MALASPQSPDPDLRDMQELTIGAGNQPLEIEDEWRKGSSYPLVVGANGTDIGAPF